MQYYFILPLFAWIFDIPRISERFQHFQIYKNFCIVEKIFNVRQEEVEITFIQCIHSTHTPYISMFLPIMPIDGDGKSFVSDVYDRIARR